MARIREFCRIEIVPPGATRGFREVEAPQAVFREAEAAEPQPQPKGEISMNPSQREQLDALLRTAEETNDPEDWAALATAVKAMLSGSDVAAEEAAPADEWVVAAEAESHRACEACKHLNETGVSRCENCGHPLDEEAIMRESDRSTARPGSAAAYAGGYFGHDEFGFPNPVPPLARDTDPLSAPLRESRRPASGRSAADALRSYCDGGSRDPFAPL